MSCISVQIGRVGGIIAQTGRVGGISVHAGLVCDAGLYKYLRVTPESVQWITVETPIDYNIESNVIWNIQ